MLFPVLPRRRIFGYPGMFKDCLKMFLRNQVKEGDWVAKFENKFAQYIGIKYAIAVSSGRMGLGLILQGLALDHHAEVILPAYTDSSVPSTILKLGLKPVFADINPGNHNIDTSKMEEKITEKTKAIIATHLFGRPCDLDRILEIAQKYNLIVIEDCAHSIGTEYLTQIPDKKWRKVGTFGRAAFFSFSATKILNTFGGGMITTNDQALAEKIKNKINKFSYPGRFTILKKVTFTFILWLLTRPAIFTLTGFPIIRLLSVLRYDILNLYNKTIKKPIKSEYKNFKFTNLQAFVGLQQLKNIDLLNRRHVANAHLLKKLSGDTVAADFSLRKDVKILEDVPSTKPTYYFFVMVAADFNLRRNLLKKRIDTGEKIMRNCAELFGSKERCPETEQAITHSLQIPIYFPLGEGDISHIANAIKNSLATEFHRFPQKFSL